MRATRIASVLGANRQRVLPSGSDSRSGRARKGEGEAASCWWLTSAAERLGRCVSRRRQAGLVVGVCGSGIRGDGSAAANGCSHATSLTGLAGTHAFPLTSPPTWGCPSSRTARGRPLVRDSSHSAQGRAVGRPQGALGLPPRSWRLRRTNDCSSSPRALLHSLYKRTIRKRFLWAFHLSFPRCAQYLQDRPAGGPAD